MSCVAAVDARRRARAGRGSRTAQAWARSVSSTAYTVAVGHSVLDGERDGARPGAQVDHDRCVPAGERAQGEVDEQLGLRPRHEDAGADLEGQPPEVRASGEVLQRHPARALVDEVRVPVRRLDPTEDHEPPASRSTSSPRRWAARCRASTGADSTPASARVMVARRTAVAERQPRRLTRPRPRPAGPPRRRRRRTDDGVEVTVEDRVEVVRLEAGAVVADPVLGEVVGADPLRAVDGADLAAAGGGRLGVRLRPGPPGAAGRAGPASRPPCSAAATSRSGRRRRSRSAGG